MKHAGGTYLGYLFPEKKITCVFVMGGILL
jgi:hypothetical protein